MTESRDGGSRVPKLLAAGSIKIKVAAASGLVLALGAWLAPRTAPTALVAPQEHAAPLLEEQVQRDVVRPFVGVQEIAAQVSQYGVAILSPPIPVAPSRNDYSESAPQEPTVAGYGVFVSDTHVLTHSAALNGRSGADVWLSDGRARPGRVVSYEPSTGLVLLEVDDPAPRGSLTLATEVPKAGALAVAVGRSESDELAVPVFITSVKGAWYTIGAVSEAIVAGMPVFNLAGELFAITAPGGREARAIAVQAATERMLARAASGDRRSSFGLEFQLPMGRLGDTFGHDGVLISDVLPGGPGDTADIRAGDVLLAIGDVSIDSPDTAARLLGTATVGTPTTIRVRRGTRVSEFDATPTTAYEIAALARSYGGRSEAPEARALFPAPVLVAAAIPPLARVVSVNGRTATSRIQVQRELRAARKPIPVLLRQDNRQFFTAVEPMR